MKKLLIAFLFLAFSLGSFAQKYETRYALSTSFGKYGYLDHTYASASSRDVPGISFQVEKILRNNISIGAYLGYTAQIFEYNHNTYEDKFRYYRFGFIFNYEFNELLRDAGARLPKELILYGSLKTGLNLRSHKVYHEKWDNHNNKYTEDKVSNDIILSLGPAAGIRYYFYNNIAAFSEIGWGNAGFFTLGLSLDL